MQFRLQILMQCVGGEKNKDYDRKTERFMDIHVNHRTFTYHRHALQMVQYSIK
jgi:hypothetical protein